MSDIKIALIGGSGLYDMDGLSSVEPIKIDTPFGKPSDTLVTGRLENVKVAFLPRHGKRHHLLPNEIPYRANIYALKSLGVERIISINAVGSLQEDIAPLDIVIPDQLIDRTKQRLNTFFGNGIVAHVGLAEPFCKELTSLYRKYRLLFPLDSALQLNTRLRIGGSLVVIEGPQFSTKAESSIYRSRNASIIGMTTLPEAQLAREAEICFSTMALVTDYDVWRTPSEEVTAVMVAGNVKKNTAIAMSTAKDIIKMIPADRKCECASALEGAIMTQRGEIPHKVLDKISLITRKYI